MTAIQADADTASVPEDGRHARRDRNRLAVVDAMLQLYAEGNLDPSSDEIAERAGLSPRSLFRYFDDLDDLVRGAIGRQHERLLPLARLDVSVDSPLAARVARLVD
ncbi:MAG: TetR/AcrR family transcriptional regulator, partial [Ilumatobacteraceae bacterium]